MGNADEGDPILAVLKSRITDPTLALVVEGLESVAAHHQNRLDDALSIGRRVLATPTAPPWAIAWAAVAVSLSLGPIGRGNDIDVIADRLDLVKSRVDRLLVHTAEFGEIQALTFTGRFADAEHKASEFRGFSGQYPAWGMAGMTPGWVESAQGRFGHAVDTLQAPVAALLSDAAPAWTYPARIALCKAHAALGRVSDAESVIAPARFGPHTFGLQPQVRSAEAWVAAAQGAPVRAIDLAHDVAHAAADSHQFAVETEALHAAARFGDRSVARRLAELATQIDGALGPLYARHVAAVAAGDGGALDRCAVEFERFGALLSAADAAAQAATAHDHGDDRRRTAVSAPLANRLAALCGGATTPAIRMVP